MGKYTYQQYSATLQTSDGLLSFYPIGQSKWCGIGVREPIRNILANAGVLPNTIEKRERVEFIKTAAIACQAAGVTLKPQCLLVVTWITEDHTWRLMRDRHAPVKQAWTIRHHEADRPFFILEPLPGPVKTFRTRDGAVDWAQRHQAVLDSLAEGE